MEASEQDRRLIQRWIGAPQTGNLNDLETVEELKHDVVGLREYLIAKDPKPEDDRQFNTDSSYPAPDHASMVRYYGRPGTDSNIVQIEFPYPMKLYSRGAPANYMRNWGVHKRLHDDLYSVLLDLQDHFGEEGLEKYGLNIFGGIYNDRPVTGGTSKSKHAWGAAIDINPLENRYNQVWHIDHIGEPGYANMPLEAIEIFEARGWKSGGRAWGQDAMHFQATK